MSSSELIKNKCNEKFIEVSARYAQGDSCLFISHSGEFSLEQVNNLSSQVEEAMFEAGDKKAVVKRMFSVLVEGLQNTRIHGEKADDGQQIAFVAIGQASGHYKLTIANLVPLSAEQFLSEKIDFINQHDEAGVKSIYMEVLTNGVISNKGGAGLGFITMSMKSKNKLAYAITPVADDLALFTVEMTIDRSN